MIRNYHRGTYIGHGVRNAEDIAREGSKTKLPWYFIYNYCNGFSGLAGARAEAVIDNCLHERKMGLGAVSVTSIIA